MLKANSKDQWRQGAEVERCVTYSRVVNPSTTISNPRRNFASCTIPQTFNHSLQRANSLVLPGKGEKKICESDFASLIKFDPNNYKSKFKEKKKSMVKEVEK